MEQPPTCKQIRIARPEKLTAAIPVDYAADMQKILIKNRKAKRDFEVLERYSAGIALLGHEVKSLKNGGGNFTGAFISLKNEEAFLKGFNIALYEKASIEDYNPTRPRKLLLRKAQLLKLTSALNTQGVTLIPLTCGLDKGKIKIEIALARGKKQYDKRESIKKRHVERRIKNIT